MSPREEGGSGGELVEVAAARNAIEAGMLKDLLDEAGIPSMLRGSGIDGPQIGIGLLPEHGGPQRLLVHAARREEARAVLADVLTAEEDPAAEALAASERRLEYSGGGRGPRDYGLLGAYARIYLVSFAVIVAAFAVFLLLRLL